MIDWSELVSSRHAKDVRPAMPSRIQIPRPPHSVMEFLKLVERPEVSLSQLAGIVERDVELTSNVLRLVNSSETMLRQKISSIQHAIGLLGIRRCKMLVMSAALQASFHVKGNGATGFETILSESQERAMYATKVAYMLNVDADHAYVAALLQDLLLFQLRDQFAAIYQKYDQNEHSIVKFEREQFEWDHASVAAQLLHNWNFPDEIVASVSYHHDHDVILANEELLSSPLAAVAISSLLPGIYQQEPDAIHLFMQYQNVLPQFDFLEIAHQVDVEANPTARGRRIPMADRLERQALAAVRSSRQRENWIEQQLGSYTIEEEIGRGGMGIVYRARHTMLRRPAAVKLMQASKVSEESLNRFHAEARTTSELSSPHTVQVYDHGVTLDGTLYYVMEYLEGMTLTEIVNEYGPLPEGRMIHVLCQVCGSLSEAHAKGLIHRDIKPENVVLTVCGGAHDFAKVLDFGLVSVLGEQITEGGQTTLFGTPSYMSPESIQFPDDIDHLADVYALGAVAYYLASGKVLFGEMSLREIVRAQVERPIPPIQTPAHQNVSKEFQSIVMSCLEKNPSRRPQSVVSLARLLSALPAADDWSFLDAEQWWAAEGRNEKRKKAQPSTSSKSSQDCGATQPGREILSAMNLNSEHSKTISPKVHHATTVLMDRALHSSESLADSDHSAFKS